MTLGIPKTIAWLLMALVMNLAAFDPWLLASEGGALDRADGEALEAPAGKAVPPDSLVSPENPAQEAVRAPSAAVPSVTVPSVTAPQEPFDRLILTDRGVTMTPDTTARKGTPVYKRWWFWTVAASVATAAVVLSVAGAEESRKDLPDFPNPPER